MIPYSIIIQKNPVIFIRLSPGFIHCYLKQITVMILNLSQPIQQLTHSHTMIPFDAPGKQAFYTVGKGEIACNKQFLLFPQCFLPVWITFFHFCQIRNCRLQTRNKQFLLFPQCFLPVWITIFHFRQI